MYGHVEAAFYYERVVCTQLLDHMENNNLNVPLQSAYKMFHSTETALVCVQNDLLRAMDKRCVTMLILLDLSAAFDTVDIDILLQRLEHRFGINGNVLCWLSSYLNCRKQCVTVNKCKSDKVMLSCGVPQGSVLGPILFSMYTAPLSDIISETIPLF